MPEYINFSKYRDIIGRSKWIWPGILAVSAGLVVILFVTNLSTPLRSVLALWFLLVCPGMSIVRIFDVQAFLLEWVLAITLSISLAGAIATLMVYTATWSPALGLSILIIITIVGVIIQSLLNLRIIAWPTSEISMPLPKSKNADDAPKTKAQKKQE